MALSVLRTCLSLAPRPASTNIRALAVHLVAQLRGIPSQKSPKHGFTCIVQKMEVYTLNSAELWVDYINPGPMHRRMDVTLLPIQ